MFVIWASFANDIPVQDAVTVLLQKFPLSMISSNDHFGDYITNVAMVDSQHTGLNGNPVLRSAVRLRERVGPGVRINFQFGEELGTITIAKDRIVVSSASKPDVRAIDDLKATVGQFGQVSFSMYDK